MHTCEYIYVYIYIYIYTYAYTYIYTYISEYIHTLLMYSGWGGGTPRVAWRDEGLEWRWQDEQD